MLSLCLQRIVFAIGSGVELTIRLKSAQQQLARRNRRDR